MKTITIKELSKEYDVYFTLMRDLLCRPECERYRDKCSSKPFRYADTVQFRRNLIKALAKRGHYV